MIRRQAFTLIELLIVVVIILAMTAVAVPPLRGTLEIQRLRNAADTIRALWIEARVNAMEEGQIFCFRSQIGGNNIRIDRVLDTHFTAGLASRNTTRRFEMKNEWDPFEKGNFTGDDAEDYILRDPAQSAEETGATVINLPDTVFAADLIVIPDERAAFYLGLTSADPSELEENSSESEEVARQELRMGETAASDGFQWSAPVFFYPDGTSSTAAILLKTDSGRCIEVRLRGLTGTGHATELMSAENYSGELDSSRQRAL